MHLYLILKVSFLFALKFDTNYMDQIDYCENMDDFMSLDLFFLSFRLSFFFFLLVLSLPPLPSIIYQHPLPPVVSLPPITVDADWR